MSKSPRSHPMEVCPEARADLQGSKGLGLEIGNIAELPDAEDYASHEFYIANFTPSEIAYCTKQPETKAAFQGLLAAKRAIIKSGAVSVPPEEGPRSVEISFDGEGRSDPSRLPLIDQPYGHDRCGDLFLAWRACLAGPGGRGRCAGPLSLGDLSAQNKNIRVSDFVVAVNHFRIGTLEGARYCPWREAVTAIAFDRACRTGHREPGSIRSLRLLRKPRRVSQPGSAIRLRQPRASARVRRAERTGAPPLRDFW